MTASKRKHANIMMEKLPTTLTPDDGVGKLFRTSRSHWKCSSAIYLAFAWKFTYELLSLQARSSDGGPPPYLYIVKIENFHPILTPSLTILKIDFVILHMKGTQHFAIPPRDFVVHLLPEIMSPPRYAFRYQQ